METLRDQVVMLKEAEVASWNPRGKFLVVVANSDDVSSKELGLYIYIYRIVEGTLYY
jgi:nitrate reductase NapAB chaperone NapD